MIMTMIMTMTMKKYNIKHNSYIITVDEIISQIIRTVRGIVYGDHTEVC